MCRKLRDFPFFSISFLRISIPLIALIVTASAASREPLTIHQGSMGSAKFRVTVIPASDKSAAGRPVHLNAADSKPLSLATADFNHDGYPDLVAAFTSGTGGVLTVHMADPAAFAPQSVEALGAVARGQFPEPFLRAASAIYTDAPPEILLTGDFNGDGNADILFAARGDNGFYVLDGDGAGHFGAAHRVVVPGSVTAIVAASLQTTVRDSDVVVGIGTGKSSAMLVYTVARGGLSGQPAVYPTGDSITSLAFGDFDGDPCGDVAAAAGRRLVILHGCGSSSSAGLRLESVPLDFGARMIAAGSFTGRRGRAAEVAILADDGEIHILSREMRGRLEPSTARLHAGPHAPAATGSGRWTAALSDTRFKGRRLSVFAAARISGNGADDLIVAEALGKELSILNSASLSGPSANGLPKLQAASVFDTAQAPVAILPMRLSVMGAPGFVMLAQGDTEIIAETSLPGVTYHVAGLADSPSGTCTTPSGSPLASSCTTLRAAVIAANANPGQDLIVFDVNGTITLSVPGQDDEAAVGDLDVIDALTIVGNGASNTVIQGGASAASGIDKVFSFNPLGMQPGFPVSISGLTIQFGVNGVTAFGNSEGGAFDFDAGAFDGAGSLAVSNCNILQNSTTNGDGGGIALFDGGTVTIAGSTISGNLAKTTQGDQFYLGEGGGIYIGNANPFPANVTIANSTVAGNSASSTGQNSQLGGGIYSQDTSTLDVDSITILYFRNSVAIPGSTISGNHSDQDGGGLYGTVVVDQGSAITGNVAGGHGGGVFGVASVGNSTLTNNSAATGGGALYTTGPGSTISNSRIAGNTSAQGFAGVDGDSTMGATVSATHNWWGSNASPASVVAPGIVSYSPWLVMTFAAPSSINAGASSPLTASIVTGSDGSSGFAVPDGTPATFTGSLGTLLPGVATTTSGAATSMYTAGASAGTASVSATIDSQTLSASLTVVGSPAPTLTSISPASGVQGTTVPVTLTGTNFVAGATVATNNPGIAVSPATVVSATQITATFTIAANAAPGAANVTVTTSGGTSGAVAFTVPYPAPKLSAISPTFVVITMNSGTTVIAATVPVTLTGTNFQPGATISLTYWGGLSSKVWADQIVVVSPTQMTANFHFPADAVEGGSHDVKMTTAGGTSNPVALQVMLVSPFQ